MLGTDAPIDTERVAEIVVSREGQVWRASGWVASNEVVLTVAHVVTEVPAAEVQVRFGAYRLDGSRAVTIPAVALLVPGTSDVDVAAIVIDPVGEVDPIPYGRTGRETAVLTCRAVGCVINPALHRSRRRTRTGRLLRCGGHAVRPVVVKSSETGCV
jgi:hypothetical protein